MPTKAEKHQRTDEQTLSADAQIARLVDLISTQFNGDIAGYFESVARPKAEDEAELDEKESVQLFLRSYR
jgi:hypothetical protein